MKSSISIPESKILKHVHVIREKRVVLDKDLAALIGIPAANIKRVVKSNISRFPADFAFSLNKAELEKLSHKGVGLNGNGIMKYAPMAFTSEGVEMLTSVLSTEK